MATTDNSDIFLVRNVTATHSTKVRRFELTVDHKPSKHLEQTREMDEGQFRGAGHQREHALAKECPTQINAIETTYERVVFIPYFNTRCKTLTMEFSIGLDDIGAQPGTIFFITILGCGTTSDDTIEVLVDGKLILMLFYQLLHGVTDVNLLGEDDEALQGTIPEGLLAIAEREPREETVGIGQQQTVDGEVATYSNQAIFFAQMRVRKPESFV